jgi:peptidoglycan/xylan/chitin deacetylase (PgdA/CDA1 family)
VKPPSPERVVALTFDLCELSDQISGYDNRIVNLLRAAEIPATFFAGGHWLKTHQEAGLQLLADPLFEVGNHAWTHGNLAVLDPSQRREQVLWTQIQYRGLHAELARRAAAAGLSIEMAVVPEHPRLFRLPYGRADQATLELLGDLGLPVIQWSITLDENASRGSTSQVAAEAAGRVRPGSIILLHANGVPKSTVSVLAELKALLQRSGYRFVTVSTLLRQGPAAISEDCFFERAGDNLKLDEIYGDGIRHPRRRP